MSVGDQWLWWWWRNQRQQKQQQQLPRVYQWLLLFLGFWDVCGSDRGGLSGTYLIDTCTKRT